MQLFQTIVKFKDKNGAYHKYLATLEYAGDGWKVIDSDLKEIERIKNCEKDQAKTQSFFYACSYARGNL